MDSKQFFHNVTLSFHATNLRLPVRPAKYFVALLRIPVGLARFASTRTVEAAEIRSHPRPSMVKPVCVTMESSLPFSRRFLTTDLTDFTDKTKDKTWPEIPRLPFSNP
jgi:hypothetical protein